MTNGNNIVVFLLKYQVEHLSQITRKKINPWTLPKALAIVGKMGRDINIHHFIGWLGGCLEGIFIKCEW